MSEPGEPPGAQDQEDQSQDQLVRYAEDLRRARGSHRVLGRRFVKATEGRKRVLIVDDEKQLRLLVSATLGSEDYEILEASRGTEAFTLARAKRPALIILDVRIPDLNGVEVCQLIRADPELRETPIIMVTSAGTESERRAGLEAGANRYLTKPFSPTQLLDAVEQLLRQRQDDATQPGA